jgi:hypothetical protein
MVARRERWHSVTIAKMTAGHLFHSITWIGYERLRRQHARLSLPPPEAVARLRDVLAEVA